MENIFKELREYFENTPQEVLDEEWEKIKQINMKIRAKKGTEFESIVKSMYEKVESEQELAKDMVENLCGIRPIDVGYIWFSHFTAIYKYDIITFSDEVTVVPYFIRNKKFEDNVYKPNKRIKKVRCFAELWNKTFCGIKSEILRTKFGISTTGELTFSHWFLYKDDKGYYIGTSPTVLDRMKNTETENYYIETENK